MLLYDELFEGCQAFFVTSFRTVSHQPAAFWNGRKKGAPREIHGALSNSRYDRISLFCVVIQRITGIDVRFVFPVDIGIRFIFINRHVEFFFRFDGNFFIHLVQYLL